MLTLSLQLQVLFLSYRETPQLRPASVLTGQNLQTEKRTEFPLSEKFIS